LIKKTLHICGNSYSAGTYLHSIEDGERIVGSNIPYGKIIADKLDMDLVLLARPSASNYFVCKQVEYAIEQKADFIIVNFSSPRHLDFTLPGNKLKKLPKLSNFEYNENIWWKNLENPAKNGIDDEVIKSWYLSLFDIYKETTNPEFEIVSKFLNSYNDLVLRIDQERLMVMGLMSQLEKSGIKFIVVDFLGLSDQLEKTGEIKSLADINLLNYMKVEPFLSFPEEFINQYPNPNDSFHFNQEGNYVVADKLIPLVTALLG
jgi:hypothetical protein